MYNSNIVKMYYLRRCIIIIIFLKLVFEVLTLLTEKE